MSSVWTFATVALAIGAAIIYQKPIANILTNIAQLCKMIFQLKDGFLTYEVRDNSGLVKLERFRCLMLQISRLEEDSNIQKLHRLSSEEKRKAR
jgi:hypothetical protein